MSTALTMLAWREIFARIMDGFDLQENVSPDWLVNPATNRRLKLDLLYPEAGLAVRYVGLLAKGQRRQGDWEIQEQGVRDDIRAELCRQNGVELFLLELENADPRRQLRELRTALSRLSRWLAQGERPDGEKLAFMPRLAAARSRLDEIAARVRGPDDLAIFAELWRDREAALVAEARRLGPRSATAPPRLQRLRAGQAVRHERFGPGTVVAVEGAADDLRITVRFVDDQERTFLASLVAGKLAPA